MYPQEGNRIQHQIGKRKQQKLEAKSQKFLGKTVKTRRNVFYE